MTSFEHRLQRRKSGSCAEIDDATGDGRRTAVGVIRISPFVEKVMPAVQDRQELHPRRTRRTAAMGWGGVGAPLIEFEGVGRGLVDTPERHYTLLVLG